MAKKRHHFVPQGYLKHFVDGSGFVHVIRKDSPDKAFLQKPDSFAFHKYYYAQPLPGGGRDTDALENLFSTLEAKWPPIIERLSRKENVNDELEAIFQFVALQRARVPAMRDAIELMEAARVKSTMKVMAAAGILPRPPKEYPPDLLDHVTVSIDPHRSILAIPRLIQDMGLVFDRIGIGVLHNTTGIPFVTSDNPVVFFDPAEPPESMKPYTLDRPDSPVVLLMPLTPTMMLYGHSIAKPSFAQFGIVHGDLADEAKVHLMNEQICRFAYEAVFAPRPGSEPMVQPFAMESPIVRVSSIKVNGGVADIVQFAFGPRPTKPKWDPRPDTDEDYA
jgi:hypothetical protein